MASVSPARIDEALAKARVWLLARQGADGFWRSETYGSLAGGIATTSFVAETLARLAMLSPHVDRIAALRTPLTTAIAALRPGFRHGRGVLGDDGTADFPTYATALVLLTSQHWQRAETAAGREGTQPLLSRTERAALVTYLRHVQLTPSQGFAPDSVHVGGWDAIGEYDARGVTHGSSASVTALVIDSLLGEEDGLPTPARTAAAGWVTRNHGQTDAGGFAFNPELENDLNKAGTITDGTKLRSYGTMTLDGFRAARQLTPEVDPKVAETAQTWLANNRRFDRVPGFEDAENPWTEGLIHYWFAGWGRAIPMLSTEVVNDVLEPLFTAVLASQKQDGSWQNGLSLMREDDPLLATCLATHGLIGVRSRLIDTP